MVSATDLSNYIVYEAYQRGKPITQLKLQKILYYVQGKYLALYRRPLFPEDIEAWAYGPVVREVYVKYVSNGALPLKPDGKELMPNLSQQEKDCVDSVKITISQPLKSTKSWDKLGQFTKKRAFY